MNKKLLCAAALLTVAQLNFSVAYAETQKFEPAYFASYVPQTALDMVRRIPGFSINEGDSVRGFGGAAGNVLIDGERPSAKSSSLQDVLTAVPAASVSHIELIDAASVGIDAGGSALVVNVVRLEGASGAGSAKLNFAVQRGDRLAPYGEISWSGQVLKGVTGTLGLKGGQVQSEYLIGREKITDRNDVIIGQGPNRDRRIRWYQSGTAAFSGGAADTPFNINIKLENGRFSRDYWVDAQDGAQRPVTFDSGFERNNEQEFEVGGDISRPGPWGAVWKLTGLANGENEANTNVFRQRQANNPNLFSASEFTSEGSSGERLARLSLTGKTTQHNWDVGLEVAFNFLDASQKLKTSSGGPFVNVPLSIANSRVEELRYELSARDAWQMTPTLSLEGGLKLESSTIEQSGDAKKSRSFFYPKPSAAFSWRPREGWTVRGRVEREVGQLNFGDFVSSSDVQDSRQNAGNPELEPDQTWHTELGFERRWGAKNVVEFTVFYDAIDGAIGDIPVADGGEAIGNVGDAKQWGLNLSTTLQTDPIGIKNGELSVDWAWQDNEITDPVTLKSRPLSGNGNRYFWTSFRQDISPGKLSWGFDYGREGLRRQFTRRETIVWTEAQFVTLYADATLRKGITARFGVDNPGGATFRRSRSIWEGSRATSPLSITAGRERRLRPSYFVHFAASF